MELREDISRSFHAWDYVVFGVCIAISIGIGVFHAIVSRRKNNTDEYLVGGRNMGFIPTAISFVASFESSILMLGLPAEVYYFGFQFIWWMIGMTLSQIIAINVVCPLMHPLKITSAYEYLELRFGSKAVRLLATAMGIFGYIWYMAIVVYGPAVALEAVTSFPQWSSIMITCICAVIYTSIGGLKAVIWADVFQGIVMMAGVFAILIQGTIEVGGPKKVWDVADAGGRMNFFNFDPDPRVRNTFWSLFLGSIFRGFSQVFNQTSVQRISSTKSVKDARRMMMFSAPAYFISGTLALYEGIVAYSYFQTKGCDPLLSGQIRDGNQLVPFTVLDLFNHLPGMSGLFLAALFSATLSTLSSGLSSSAALLWTDVIHPLVPDISESKSTIILKILVVIFGGVACGFTFMVAEIKGAVLQMALALTAAFTGPLTGIFFLGCFLPRSNAKGACIGGFLTMVLCIWISMGQSFSPSVKDPVPLPLASTDQCFVTPIVNSTEASAATSAITTTLAYMNTTTPAIPVPEDSGPSGEEHLYQVSYQYVSAIGALGTVIVGTLISLVTGMNKPGDVDPRYLISFTDSFLVFLPQCIRRPLKRIGGQFMDDKYRANPDDPSQMESGKNGGPKMALASDNTIGDTKGKSYDLTQAHFTPGGDNYNNKTDGLDNKAFSQL